jgi:hypothetical protein
MPDDMSFYLVRVGAVRTGDSIYSPLFNVLTGPDPQTQKVGEEKKEWAQRHQDRMDFWRALLGNDRIKTTLFAHQQPGSDKYLSVSAGIPNGWFSFEVAIYASYAYLTFKFNDAQKTKAVFSVLLSQKRQVEKQFGEELIWQEPIGNHWPWIGKMFPERGLRTPEAWPKLHAEMIEAVVRLDKILRVRLRQAYDKMVRGSHE